MFHEIIFGLLLGWGAAIPIGPINLEVIRRNLQFGSRFGISFGLGACSADMTYFILLLAGALVLLQHELVLRIIGIIGALILLWFGISAIRLKSASTDRENIKKKKDPKAWHHYFQAYFMTLLNPITILFWASVSSQIASLSHHGIVSAIYVGIGVLLGTSSWILALNTALHFTRHRISDKVMHYFNIVGGIILIGFAAFGFIHALR
ncbi:LysE family translocator [Candidiatus Paracoxiella cheracis]|uniref:LysE family translocator n=1 Tax=Candidiatus Paracoxiella cheracis TaxID=3405120 RepID=UPI003BF5A625